MNWWVLNLYEQGQVVQLVSWIFWVIFSIVMHELAHGWAALWQGDDTPRRMGHMTINPVVHMGPWSLLMFAMIGIAWGMMPVDPGRFRWRRRGRIVVSGAGPAMNIALALVTLTTAAVWTVYGPRNSEPFYTNVFVFLFTGGWLNFALAAFNLLPIHPLDGASVLMGLSFRFYRLMQHPQAQMVGMLILLAVFMSGLGAFFFAGALWLGSAYLDGVMALLPHAPESLTSAGFPPG